MVSKKAIIVVGLGYGDEGKGITTDYLCLHNLNTIVVRFNGGHQAGHCVVTKEGKKHVFSNFGSGTLRGISTYWSSYCTFEPLFFIEELDVLGFDPKIYIDKLCPITTHYDILYNRALETTLGNNRRGSCGVGFGATIDRCKIQELNFTFEDFLVPEKAVKKLELIREYYRKKINLETAFVFDNFLYNEEDTLFINSIKTIHELISKNVIIPACEHEMFSNNNVWETYIFEGSQAILLDKYFGTKPHITKSNTTSKNALDILKRQNIHPQNIEIFYVTRAYQTRHGAGPFRDKNQNFVLCNNSQETNLSNEYQGEVRYNYLDVDLINYAIECDTKYSREITKNLMITCLDHIGSEDISFYKNNILTKINYREFSKAILCDFKSVKYSFSNCAEFIK